MQERQLVVFTFSDSTSDIVDKHSLEFVNKQKLYKQEVLSKVDSKMPEIKKSKGYFNVKVTNGMFSAPIPEDFDDKLRDELYEIITGQNQVGR